MRKCIVLRSAERSVDELLGFDEYADASLLDALHERMELGIIIL